MSIRFTFLHCADLHLGSPLLGLSMKDEAVARRFATASRDAFSDLVSQAIEARVAFMLIAGDIYDGEWTDNSIGLYFNREMARLARQNIDVFLVRGNHDAESVVTKTISLPDNVKQFSTRSAETREIAAIRVAIHGRGFPDRAVTENWAIAYPPPKPGWFNIGLLHTSVEGRPPHATYAPCSVQDLVARGYDYWALGHVHEFEILSREPWIVFPGNIQGRSVRECGSKGAVFVDVEDGRVVSEPRRVIVDRARWADVTVDMANVEMRADAIRAIEMQLAPIARTARGRLLAARVRLVGATPLHRALLANRAGLMDEAQAAAHRADEDIWIEKLVIDTREPAARTSEVADMSALDLATTLEDCARDEVLRGRAADIIARIAARFPGGMAADEAPLADEMDAILAEARALALDRAATPDKNA